jgi:hypothetical protein
MGSLALSKKPYPHQLEIQKVYSTFAKLAPTYPQWFPTMNFRGKAGEETSSLLESVLFDLGIAGLTAIENPLYRYIHVKEDARKQIQTFLRARLSDGEYKTLENIAEDFQKYIASRKTLYGEPAKKAQRLDHSASK